jgi:hypothetical protein
MADVTINQLTSAPSIVSSLLLPATDGTSTYKLSVANVNSLAPVQSVAGRTGSVTLTNSDVGLGNVENKSSATIRGEITSSNVITALNFTPYNNTNPNGYIANTNASVAKAWVSFTGVGTNGQAVTTLDKYNVSSVVRNTINSWTINFTAGTFSNANYIVTGCGRFLNTANNDSAPLFGVHRFTDPTSSSCRVSCIWNAGSVEIQTVYAAFFGS